MEREERTGVDEVAEAEVRGILSRELQRLGEDLRCALVLRFEEGMSFAAVGEALGISGPSARERVERGLERLRDSYLPDHCTPDTPLLVCGDFNVAPHDLDVHDPALWENTTICHPQVRMRMQRVLDFGLTDTFRHLHPDAPGAFTWWDYRNQALENNLGVRIDFILATDPMIARLERAWTDRDERAGKKPSDHAPVLAEFS